MELAEARQLEEEQREINEIQFVAIDTQGDDVTEFDAKDMATPNSAKQRLFAQKNNLSVKVEDSDLSAAAKPADIVSSPRSGK